MEAHEYANLFPMMTGLELDALAEDVKANGLRHPAVRYRGMVLDGRNRLKACEMAGVEPTFTDYDGDDAGALALVISLNVQRRDLTAAQRAIAAARALPAFEVVRAKNRGGDRRSANQHGKSSHVGTSREDAAKVFKVSDKSVQQAKAILSEAPDLAGQVESCALSLAAAHEQLQARRRVAAQKARDAERVAEFRDAISSGDMDVEQALQTAIEQEREEKAALAAEADARSSWLKGLAAALGWLETYAGEGVRGDVGWYFDPAAPGAFGHGVTPERIASVMRTLQRIHQALDTRDNHGEPGGVAPRSRTA